MSLRAGQVIAIPVLTRHINTSSGKCADKGSEYYNRNCVMADALRDRFPEATRVSVGGKNANLDFADGSYIELLSSTDGDFTQSVLAFDELVGDVRYGRKTLQFVRRLLRQSIPRTVHATVAYVGHD